MTQLGGKASTYPKLQTLVSRGIIKKQNKTLFVFEK